MSKSSKAKGQVSPGFEVVREAFADNFARRGELGGACCAYHRGEKVVDLWGGVRNKQTGDPWEQDTMVIVYSATKGLAAMTLAIAHSRGWLDYEERVCAYWPEFAQQGKGSASPFASSWHTRPGCTCSTSLWIAASSPTSIAWPSSWHARNLRGNRARGRPITASPSASTRASCCAASIRSIAAWDSSSRTRSPRRSGWTSISGCPRTSRTRGWRRWRGPRCWICCTAFRFASRSTRSIHAPKSSERSGVPSCRMMNGASTRATSKCRPAALSVLPARSPMPTASSPPAAASWGCDRETLDLLAAPAIPPARGFYDECMKVHGVQFSLGFMKSTPALPFGSASSFGSPGAGGALGFADPAAGVGYAYVTNQMGTRLAGDPRDVALREALDSRIPTPRGAAGRLVA